MAFSNSHGTYNLTAYSSMMEFLTDVWNDAFRHWDCRVSTNAAADLATRTQDNAEVFWRHNA